MLSRKRQIMFEVLGRRAAAPRSGVADRPARAATGGKKSPGRARGRESPPVPRSWLLAIGGVAVVASGLVAWRVHRGGAQEAPVLQSNVEVGAATADPGRPSEVFAVCVMSRDYQSSTERRRAAEKVQETVDFLGYHSDPDFRDVRGQDHPGKESGTGTFRVYVGSARSRSELVALKNRLAAVVWNRTRPFQNATVKVVPVANPGR